MNTVRTLATHRCGGGFVTALLLALLYSSAYASSNAVGIIYGKAIDEQGTALPDVLVEIQNRSTGITRHATSDDEGRFRFPSVTVGDYTVRALRDGYFEETIEDVRVNLSKARSLSFVLYETEPGQTIEEIEVVGHRYSRVDLASTDSSTTITHEAIEQMPLGRSTTSVALLTPGTQQGDSAFGALASFGGASVAENAYYINGMNVTDFRNGLGFSFAPFEFYDEYEVKSGGYSAEFGRSIGGVVNAVTKSGGNDFEFGGGVLYTPDSLWQKPPNVYLPDGSLDTNNKDDENSSVRPYIFASGPIIRDRAFFYAQYAPNRITNTFAGTSSLTRTVNDNPYWGLKLDFWLTGNHLLELSGFSDIREGKSRNFDYDYETRTVGVDRGVRNFKVGGVTGVARYTGYLTESLSVSGLVGVNEVEDNDWSDFDDEPVIIDFRSVPSIGLGNWANFRPGESNDKRRVYRFDLEWQLGDHNIRAGFDSESNTSYDLVTYSGGEYWAYDRFSTGDPVPDGLGSMVPPGVTDVAIRFLWDNGGSFDLDSKAVYLQDFWRVSDDLTLSLGLRHEQFANRNANGETFLKIEEQWAPRLGMAWDFRGTGESKLFATAGRYHLPMPTTVNIRLAGGEFYSEEWYPLLDLNPDDTPVIGEQFGGAVFSDGTVPETGSAVDANIEPMYQDEFILGYVTEIWDKFNVGIRGVYRTLGRAIEDTEASPVLNEYASRNGFDNFFAPPFTAYILTNPGYPMTVFIDMDFDGVPEEVNLSPDDLGLPKASRNYRALELFFERRLLDGLFYHISYTLSESKGNNEGYVRSDNGQPEPAFTTNFDYAALTDGFYGYLPNDRRHSVKAYGSWEFVENWRLGFNAYWVSGRPINAFGIHPTDLLSSFYGAESHYRDGELVPRGSDGRTESISNLDVSLQYQKDLGSRASFRATLEVFNVFNSAGVYEINEHTVDFFGQPDPAYGLPRTFQESRWARFGLHVNYR
ncbi:MAG: TonB-dependent receptor [Gammaproteobacteria bacterium]|nr:TonB-dependent receptor [Gammaproteobacteria bacterium]